MDSNLLLFLLLVVLHGSDSSLVQYVTVHEGADALLSCGNTSSPRCEADWYVLTENTSTPLFLSGHRQSGPGRSGQALTGADLLENCSLTLKNVTSEEAGYYSCSTSEHQQGAETDTVLSVYTESEHREGSVVTRSCTLWTVKFYTLTLEWRLNGEKVPKDHPQLRMSHTNSSVSVSFNDTDASSEFYRFLKCHISGGKKTRPEEKLPEPTRPTTGFLLILTAGIVGAAALVCVVVIVIWIRSKKN